MIPRKGFAGYGPLWGCAIRPNISEGVRAGIGLPEYSGPER